MTFHIDPDNGGEAAADLDDNEFQILLRIVMWELAVRTSPDRFEHHLHQIVELRADIESDLVATRHARDQRHFIAAVLNDIESLPAVPESSSELTTGLYL
jgi:hypothetical protein